MSGEAPIMQGVTLTLCGNQFTGAIVRDYYTESGAPSLEFINFEAGERIAVLSVNIGPMRAREVAIKDWTENEGTLAGLIALGIVRDTGARIGCGWCEAAVCEIIAPELLVSEEKAGALVSQTIPRSKEHARGWGKSSGPGDTLDLGPDDREDEAQPIPGSWAISDEGERSRWDILCLNINDYGNFNVCSIQRDVAGLTEQDKATARLITTVPELREVLEAAKALSAKYPTGEKWDKALEFSLGKTLARLRSAITAVEAKEAR